MSEEFLQLVDRYGNPVGTAPRSQCHGNPELIQAVVHLHLFDAAGRMYLQKRATTKDRFPGRWDTSVGGHVAPGESPEQAIRRETREEIGIDIKGCGEGGGLERLPPYIYKDEIESEYVVPYRLICSDVTKPNPQEVEEGAFFSIGKVRRRLTERPEDFTPHFALAFRHLMAVDTG